jgi:preprotein translocase subunit SecB
MADQENQPSSTDNKPVTRFDTVRIYLKDASFEAPSTPEIFLQQSEKPKTEVEVLFDYRTLDEDAGLIEVVLKVTVTSKMGESTLYIAEVHQGGLFQVQHPDPKARELVLEVTSPHILLPFVREELNSLITKGGFSVFLLTPVNFDTIYRSKLEERAKAAENPVDPNSFN